MVLLEHSGFGADEVNWDFPGVLTNSELSAQVQFPGVGVYPGTLTLHNEACNLTAVLDIAADVPTPLQGVTYEVPNVITPNNDGKNDSFSAFLLDEDGDEAAGLDPGDFIYYDLTIFNRWGNAMFESRRPGPEVSSGTYYVLLSARHLCDDELFNYSGELSILR